MSHVIIILIFPFSKGLSIYRLYGPTLSMLQPKERRDDHGEVCKQVLLPDYMKQLYLAHAKTCSIPDWFVVFLLHDMKIFSHKRLLFLLSLYNTIVLYLIFFTRSKRDMLGFQFDKAQSVARVQAVGP